jgi:hypothetical protein
VAQQGPPDLDPPPWAGREAYTGRRRRPEPSRPPQQDEEYPGPDDPEAEYQQPGHREPDFAQAEYRESDDQEPGYGPPDDQEPGYGPPDDQEPGYGPPDDREPGYREAEARRTESRRAKPRRPGPRRPGSGRARASRARRSRRRVYAVIGLVVVVAVVVLGVLGKLPFQGGSQSAAGDHLVTTYQPGELRSVPDTCQAISAATLATYLPGKAARVATQSPAGNTESQCTWTVDARPVYRVLEVTSQAYAPSLLASGDGSATNNAIDAYAQEMGGLRNPAKATHMPKALLSDATGLGPDAFSALQVIRSGRDTTDLITVVTRFRNVLITVSLQGLEHAGRGGYGPVSAATLRAGALAAAREVRAGIS